MHVIHAAVADFKAAAVEDSVKFATGWKVIVNDLEESLPYVCAHVSAVWGCITFKLKPPQCYYICMHVYVGIS